MKTKFRKKTKNGRTMTVPAVVIHSEGKDIDLTDSALGKEMSCLPTGGWIDLETQDPDSFQELPEISIGPYDYHVTRTEEIDEGVRVHVWIKQPGELEVPA